MTSLALDSLLLASLSCVLVAGCAGRFVELDPSASPNYASVDVPAGFRSRAVDVVAGGEIQARSLPTLDGGECVARNIDDHPDVRLVVHARQDLRIVVDGAGEDTTLAVHRPGGFLCDDDSAGGDDPEIRFSAEPGEYEVWVGSYLPGHYPHVRLLISAVDTRAADAPAARQPAP